MGESQGERGGWVSQWKTWEQDAIFKKDEPYG
jgi:hypothetical protein